MFLFHIDVSLSLSLFLSLSLSPSLPTPPHLPPSLKSINTSSDENFFKGLLKINTSQGDCNLFPLMLVLGIIFFNSNPKCPTPSFYHKQGYCHPFKKKKKQQQLPRPDLEDCAAPSHPTLRKHRRLFAHKGSHEIAVNNLLL